VLLQGDVDYYKEENEPGVRHACPDKIIMSKVHRFSDEREYRYAFALDKNAFQVNNVDYSLSNDVTISNTVGRPRILKLGNLLDICKIISF
jgi:hypothetical protein